MEEAKLALQAYDYAPEDGRWYHRVKRMTTQSWQETRGGFLRFDPENGAWVPYPYCIKPEFQKLGGLNFKDPAHVPCFTWVWPAEYVQNLYAAAWEAKKAQADRRAIEKGLRDAPPEPMPEELVFTEEAAAAVEAAVAEETYVEPEPEPEPEPVIEPLPRKRWWERG